MGQGIARQSEMTVRPEPELLLATTIRANSVWLESAARWVLDRDCSTHGGPAIAADVLSSVDFLAFCGQASGKPPYRHGNGMLPRANFAD